MLALIPGFPYGEAQVVKNRARGRAQSQRHRALITQQCLPALGHGSEGDHSNTEDLATPGGGTTWLTSLGLAAGSSQQ